MFVVKSPLPRLNQGEEADAINDLGYLRALGSALEKETLLREHSA